MSRYFFYQIQVSEIINESFIWCILYFKEVGTGPQREKSQSILRCISSFEADVTMLTSTKDNYFVLSYCVMLLKTQSITWPLEKEPKVASFVVFNVGVFELLKILSFPRYLPRNFKQEKNVDISKKCKSKGEIPGGKFTDRRKTYTSNYEFTCM